MVKKINFYKFVKLNRTKNIFIYFLFSYEPVIAGLIAKLVSLINKKVTRINFFIPRNGS